MRTRRAFVLSLTIVGAAAAQAQLGLGSLSGLGGGKSSADGLTSDQASGGLKEALSRGISTSVSSTGHPGGFFENAAIKILMPPKPQRVEQGYARRARDQRWTPSTLRRRSCRC